MGERVQRELQREARDELLNRETICTLEETKVLIENWRREYNTVRPHSALAHPLKVPGRLERRM